MLVLRKALFHRSLDARKVAVCGYLTILNKIHYVGRISLSQSQMSLSQESCTNSTMVQADVYFNAANPNSKLMCVEIMGILKRVLMQQSEIRQLLYEGLYEVSIKNDALIDVVLELLLSQFEKYYITDATKPPIDLEICIPKEEVNLIEPFSDLVTSIHLILIEIRKRLTNDQFDNDDYDLSAQVMLEELLQNLTKRMMEVDVFDFGVAKADDPDESLGELRTNQLHLLRSTYEALIEVSLLRNEEFKTEDCQDLLKLFENYKEVSERMSKKKSGKSTKSKSSPVVSLNGYTFMFMERVMKALFTDEVFKHQQGLNLLRAEGEFVTHIVTACNQKLAKWCDSGKTDKFSQNMPNLFHQLVSIGKVYLAAYQDGLSADFTSIDSKRFSLLFAEGLNSVFGIISTVYKKNAMKFINSIVAADCPSFRDSLKECIGIFQKFIMTLLTTDTEDNHLKILISFFSIMKHLYSLFPGDFSETIFKWVRQICIEHTFNDSQPTKALVSLCLLLNHQQSNCSALLREFAFDIHYHVGNIDADVRIQGTRKYEIINSETALILISILVPHVEQILEDVEWILNFLKSELTASTSGFSDDSENYKYDRKNMEQKICSRLSELILIFHELVQTAIPPQHVVNSILKLVTRFYKALTSLTKYYESLHSSKGIDLSTSYEKLVKLSGTQLTTQVYAFITYIQNVNSEENQKAKKPKSSIKVDTEGKTMSSLVFAIEFYERYLILLSKKCKKDLMTCMKSSTSRDFRINADTVNAALDREEEMEQDESSVANETNDPDRSVAGNQTGKNKSLSRSKKQSEKSKNTSPQAGTSRTVTQVTQPDKSTATQSKRNETTDRESTLNQTQAKKRLNLSRTATQPEKRRADDDDVPAQAPPEKRKKSLGVRKAMKK